MCFCHQLCQRNAAQAQRAFNFGNRHCNLIGNSIPKHPSISLLPQSPVHQTSPIQSQWTGHHFFSCDASLPSPDLLPKSRTSSAKQKKDTATSSTLMAPLRLLNCDSLYSKQIANKTNLLTASMLDFFTISRSELLVDRTKDVDAACNGWWRGLLRVSLQDSNKGTAA